MNYKITQYSIPVFERDILYFIQF